MSAERNDDLSHELLEQLGPEAFLALVENFGGQRIYVPAGDGGDQISAAIGLDGLRILSRTHAGNRLRVPLARPFRARHYRTKQGLTNSQIAKKLGITETGVDKLFGRAPAPKRRKATDPRQLTFFDT